MGDVKDTYNILGRDESKIGFVGLDMRLAEDSGQSLK